MTSKAQAKRNRKAYAKQRQGRPLKDGVRHPCGKLKQEPTAPNSVVLRAKAALIGVPLEKATRAQIAATENPLDLAHARGWITPDEHKAGEAIRDHYRKAGLDLPTIRTQDFDKVAKAHSEATGSARAMAALKQCWEALRHWPQARAAVFALVVMNETPAWMIDRLNGATNGERNVAYCHLRTGLRLLARELGVGQNSQEQAA